MKKIIKIFIIVNILILSFVTIVTAVSAKLDISSSSNLNTDENVIVDICLSNIDAGEGLNAFIGTLEYDTKVFETVNEEDISGANGWVIQGYNSNNGKFTALSNTYFKKGGKIATITLKVKENINTDKAIVSIKNAQVTGGTETGDIDLEVATITLNAEIEENYKPNEMILIAIVAILLLVVIIIVSIVIYKHKNKT